MDQHQELLDTLIDFAAVSSAFAATSAFLAASFSLLTGEFAGTRLYLFETALVFTLVACAFCLGIRPLRQRPPGEQ